MRVKGFEVVGANGFEPSTSWSRTRRASQAALRPDRGYSVLSPLILAPYATLSTSASTVQFGAIGAIEGHNWKPKPHSSDFFLRNGLLRLQLLLVWSDW
jgi:hypothetical protein